MLSLGTSLGLSSVGLKSSESSSGGIFNLNISWIQNEPGYGQISTEYVEIPNGYYAVAIYVENFISSSWGSHGLSLTGYVNSLPSGTWSNSTTDDFHVMNTIDENVLAFGLADPSTHGTQFGSAMFYTTESLTRFYLSGGLPVAGDTADFHITFTPLDITP